METRQLGSTGIAVSPVSFGAGPVSQLWVGPACEQQRRTIERALELGINWFDTAATYGDGASEENLGRTLQELGATASVYVASKVRIMPDQLRQLARTVQESVANSLKRLRRERITLLQIHNSITAQAGAQPTSLTPAHVLAPGGLLEQFDRLRQQGLVEHLGLTGLGEPAALSEVIATGEWATVQAPYHLLNPSAGRDMPANFSEANYGNIIAACGPHHMGVFAIRVFAGGALAGHPPSPHTFKTPFFPLDLYHRDVARAEQIADRLPDGMRREEAAVRFAISHPHVNSALIGFASPEEVAQTVQFATRGRLDTELLASLENV